MSLHRATGGTPTVPVTLVAVELVTVVSVSTTIFAEGLANDPNGENFTWTARLSPGFTVAAVGGKLSREYIELPVLLMLRILRSPTDPPERFWISKSFVAVVPVITVPKANVVGTDCMAAEP